MKNGALDAYITPIIMKKGRPAFKLSVLSNENLCNTLENIIFNETKTLGLRKYKADRTVQNRIEETIELNELGKIRVKYNINDFGKIISFKPEFDDCKMIAMAKGLSLKDVIQQFEQAIQKT